MEENLENKLILKDKLINFYIFNKKKIFISIFFTLILIGFLILKIEKDKKENSLISEKYVQAGLYLTSKKIDEARLLYEEIILSKNEFYSILSLNTIIEKNLISDTNKILNYFNVLDEIISSKNDNDLITLKKALYLIKIKDSQKGKLMLQSLVDKNSKLKPIAQEILKD